MVSEARDMVEAGGLPSSRAVAGRILEFEEFAVHDGPGIRVVVFMQGCPLQCSWCHNPESIPSDLQPGGEVVFPRDLADRLLRHERVLRASGGGVTFSGGEPMAQAAFVVQAAGELRTMHKAIETSGHITPAVFDRVTSAMDLVMIDIKHVDPAVHRRFTGRDNRLILANLDSLVRRATPFVVRVPLIPGVNDDETNLEQIAQLVAGAPALDKVELLPYNTMAPAKYPRAGRPFSPGFDTSRAVRLNPEVFTRYGIACEVL